VASYDVQLESNRFEIAEFDDNRGYSIEHANYAMIEIGKNKDGSAGSHWIRFPKKAQYFDLNGDGFLDVMVDLRGASTRDYILLENRYVQVWHGMAPGHTTATSPDFRTHYVFDNGSWRVKSRSFDLNKDGTMDAMEVFEPGELVVRIWVETKFVPVKRDQVTDTMTEATAADGSKYIFENGKWRKN
jgi:hypothetical protein